MTRLLRRGGGEGRTDRRTERKIDNLAQRTKTNETTNERILRLTNHTTRHIATKFKFGDLDIKF